MNPASRAGRLPARRSEAAVAWGLLLVLLAATAWATEDDASGGFSLVVLPDTQMYAWRHPDLFDAQTAWIAAHAERQRIRYVIHVGDVVQHNNETEWTIARAAFARLDGKVPYAIAVGNHDMGPNGTCTDRSTLFDRFFPPALFRSMDTFGGVYDREPDRAENAFHRFRAGGRDWLILVLEFGPRDDVLRWAGEVLGRNPHRWAIVVTHAYLDSDGRRYDRRLPDQHYPPHRAPMAKAQGGVNDGEEIWQKLVSRHANVKLVVSGHVCVSALLTSRAKGGNRVHQMLVDYQDQERGGTGWMRVLRFSDGGRSLSVRDYSPVLDRWSDRPDRNYQLTLAAAGDGS